MKNRARYAEWLQKTAAYRESFNSMEELFSDSFSLTKAVFLVENAFIDKKLSYTDFIQQLRFRTNLVKQIIGREKLNSKNDLALNYGIQKLFSQTNSYYNSKTKQTSSIKPFKYDFKDFQGETDYRNVFVSKMLATSNGQCHSMPLVYLMIAEQLGAKAWLSLAPQHSFIQFMDGNGNLLNFETTNGTLVSDNWLHQSGYINATAIKSRSYLDTLSQNELYAQCLADLLLGYLKKFGYDEFADKVQKRITQLNPNNMTALIIDAQIKTRVALYKIDAVGRPPEKSLPEFPEAYRAYLEMHLSYEQVDNVGYQDMPIEAYQKWLKSIEEEKKKQENKELKDRMEKEIELMKKQYVPRSTVVDRTKG